MKFILDSGNITLQDVQKQLEMKKREEIINSHKYKKWKGKDGKWHTYLPEEDGKLRHKKRKNLSDLDEDIYQFYYDKLKRPKFRQVYEEWIAEKIECEELQKNSITKYNNGFQKFFPEDEPFCDIKLVDMTDGDLEKFIKRTIKKHGLTKKTYRDFTLILHGVFKFAKREKYTDFSISTFMQDLSLPKKIFKPRIIDPSTQVFTRKEAAMLIDYFLKNPTIIHLGLALMFYTGLRIGELTTLKASDNAERYYLKVQRTEITYKENGVYCNAVKELPKGDVPRTINVPKKGQRILDQIKMMSPNGVFLFENDNGRIRSARFNYRLRKACKEIGIPPRSTHKIRKTYGSNLLENNVGEALAQSQLGHKQISTTHNFYHYNITDNEDRAREIDRAVSYN